MQSIVRVNRKLRPNFIFRSSSNAASTDQIYSKYFASKFPNTVITKDALSAFQTDISSNPSKHVSFLNRKNLLLKSLSTPTLVNTSSTPLVRNPVYAPIDFDLEPIREMIEAQTGLKGGQLSEEQVEALKEQLRKDPIAFLSDMEAVKVINSYSSSKVRVIGVGNGGCNIVENLMQKGVKGINFISANTDTMHCDVTGYRIQLGSEEHGCDENPRQGREKAQESAEELRKVINGAEIVLTTACLGGGTGSGAAPLIAEICAEQKVLNIAVVTHPFEYEGMQRTRIAREATAALLKRAGAVLVIPNQSFFESAPSGTTFAESFSLSNPTVACTISEITNAVTNDILLNASVADVKAVFSEKGYAVTLQAEGATAIDAVMSLMLNEKHASIVKRCKGFLVNVRTNGNIEKKDVDHAIANLRTICEHSDEVQLASSISHDATLTPQQVKIYLIASGLSSIV